MKTDPSVLWGRRLAVIGLGKMGEALVSGLLAREAVRREDLAATVRHAERREALASRLGVAVGTDNAEAARDRDLVVIAVKPQGVAAVLDSLRGALRPGQLVVSIAASVSTWTLEGGLPEGVPVVRVMPNTPCLLGVGMSALCAGRHATEVDLQMAQALFSAVGRTVVIDDERLMDGVTALSGSGPAYFYVVVESLAEAGVKVGLPRDVSTLLAAQTMLGAARMVLDLGAHPALLKDVVTTPAGCTIDGLLKLEEGGLRVTLIKAVVEATRRAGELAEE
ncbi:MAG: pyrroline-5-carboxylate reductase [Planctomycetes bacterium]|nr:pyrroline-5-carboxylate reductase [Planctomycetota bacterium]